MIHLTGCSSKLLGYNADKERCGSLLRASDERYHTVSLKAIILFAPLAHPTNTNL
jgi:hypothetical protein